MKERKIFGRNLKALRLKRGLTQVQLSEKLGISDIHLYYLESGRKSPSFEFVIRAHKVLKCSFDTLLKGLG